MNHAPTAPVRVTFQSRLWPATRAAWDTQAPGLWDQLQAVYEGPADSPTTLTIQTQTRAEPAGGCTTRWQAQRVTFAHQIGPANPWTAELPAVSFAEVMQTLAASLAPPRPIPLPLVAYTILDGDLFSDLVQEHLGLAGYGVRGETGWESGYCADLDLDSAGQPAAYYDTLRAQVAAGDPPPVQGLLLLLVQTGVLRPGRYLLRV